MRSPIREPEETGYEYSIRLAKFRLDLAARSNEEFVLISRTTSGAVTYIYAGGNKPISITKDAITVMHNAADARRRDFR